jgi:hypothetical protein
VGCVGVAYGGFQVATQPPASAEEQRSLWIAMFSGNGATNLLLIQVPCRVEVILVLFCCVCRL